MFGSGGVMFQKKRKMADDRDFEGNNYGILFYHVISDNMESSRKKVGRRSYCKAKKVAISAPIMGNSDDGEENKEVLSDQYKVLYEIEESDGVLKNFKEIDKEDSKFPACSISEEMVKEIGEQIGVTWARADEVTNGAKTNEIITLNVRGIGVEGKLGWIKSIIRDERLDVIGLQETESGSIEESWVEEDVNIFVCKEAIRDDRFIALRGDWKGISEDMYLACLYGPHVLRRLDDRMNSQVNVKEMDEFNEFINVTWFVEIPMGRRKFTRVSDDGIKFSKLDRFLMNKKFKNLWENLSVVALDQKLSDHCPIMFGAHDEKIEEHKREAVKWELEAENRHLSDAEMETLTFFLESHALSFTILVQSRWSFVVEWHTIACGLRSLQNYRAPVLCHRVRTMLLAELVLLAAVYRL
ncbi:RNA-directed DNA polymerase, eukaryota [Tanacetum coccineum]